MTFLICVFLCRMEPRSSRIVRPRTGCMKVGAMLREKLSVLICNMNTRLTLLEGAIQIPSPALADEELGFPYLGCR